MGFFGTRNPRLSSSAALRFFRSTVLRFSHLPLFVCHAVSTFSQKCKLVGAFSARSGAGGWFLGSCILEFLGSCILEFFGSLILCPAPHSNSHVPRFSNTYILKNRKVSESNSAAHILLEILAIPDILCYNSCGATEKRQAVSPLHFRRGASCSPVPKERGGCLNEYIRSFTTLLGYHWHLWPVSTGV